MHRDAAANLMRAFITRCPFAETLSTEQTVNLLEIFLQCIFVSTDRATSELGLERNVWQTEVLHGQIVGVLSSSVDFIISPNALVASTSCRCQVLQKMGRKNFWLFDVCRMRSLSSCSPSPKKVYPGND